MSRLYVIAEQLLGRKRLLVWLMIWLYFYIIAIEILLLILPLRQFAKLFQPPWMALIGFPIALIGLGLFLLFIYHAYRKVKFFSVGTRRMWLAIFIFLGLYGIPIYFYRYIWSDAVERSPKTEFRLTAGILIALIIVSQIHRYFNSMILWPQILGGQIGHG